MLITISFHNDNGNNYILAHSFQIEVSYDVSQVKVDVFGLLLLEISHRICQVPALFW